MSAARLPYYPGSKNQTGVWSWIVHHLPAHAYYAEPFVGSGAVLRRKAPALRSVVCDTDPDVTAWHRALAFPGVEIREACGIAWLEVHGPELGPDWLLYIDPPYPMGTRSKLKIYKQELTDGCHQRILGAIAGTAARVIVSSYDSPAYSSALASWYRSDQLTMTRGGRRTETIWCNFNPRDVARAHPSILPGRTWRERERVKRRVGRWRDNFRSMPRYEREAVLAAMIELVRGDLVGTESNNARPVKFAAGGVLHATREAAEYFLAGGDVPAASPAPTSGDGIRFLFDAHGAPERCCSVCGCGEDAIGIKDRWFAPDPRDKSHDVCTKCLPTLLERMTAASTIAGSAGGRGARRPRRGTIEKPNRKAKR
jgi:DNA adenine methylase